MLSMTEGLAIRTIAGAGTTRPSGPRWSGWLAAILLAFGLTLAAAAAAGAQELHYALDEGTGSWQLVETIELGEIYLDTARVVALDPDVYQVRTLWHFARAQHDRDGEEFRSSVAVRAIDCRARAMAILAYADQDGARVVDGVMIPAEAARWEAITPSSVVDHLAERACSLGRAVPRLAGGGAAR